MNFFECCYVSLFVMNLQKQFLKYVSMTFHNNAIMYVMIYLLWWNLKYAWRHVHANDV